VDRFSRLAPAAEEQEPAAQTDNTFRFVFSNEKVGRDQHVVLNRGIQTANYLANPVCLWFHDDSQPPIGRGSNIDTSGVNCRIDVTFVDRDVLPFAGTIRDLVAGKWLRALSMSWAPLEWQYSTDRNRPSGVDFSKVDLLEISVVPLPALPNALLDARSRGVNMRPLREWAERALDTTSRRIPRREVEAIFRAVGPTRSDRRRIAREHQARVRREDLAYRMQERIIQQDADDAEARFAHHEAVRRGEAW
jgi:hypothetical protein